MSSYTDPKTGDQIVEESGSACCPAHFLLGVIEQAMTDSQFPDDVTIVTDSFQGSSATEVAKMLTDAVSRIKERLGAVHFVPAQESPFPTSTEGYAKA